MNEQIYENYKSAGEIAAAARRYGLELVKPDARYVEVADLIEDKIIELGGQLAFPVNISVNETAAHYTPRVDDSLVFKKGDVVKLDLGAHIDGYIADTAATVEVDSSEYARLIHASEDALAAGVNALKPAVSINNVSRVIEQTITSADFNVVDNLTGHSLDRYVLHAGLSVPNVSGKASESMVPMVDDVVAIEPFATDGAGHVVHGDSSNIFRYIGPPRFRRDYKLMKTVDNIKKRFNTLPFAGRWCTDFIPNTGFMLKKLVHRGCIKEYPQLIDAEDGVVSQAEHTVIVHEDGCEVTT